MNLVLGGIDVLLESGRGCLFRLLPILFVGRGQGRGRRLPTVSTKIVLVCLFVRMRFHERNCPDGNAVEAEVFICNILSSINISIGSMERFKSKKQ